MNTRRRFLTVGLALAVIAVAASALFVHLVGPVTRWNYSRLQRGMTTEEVFGILGEPTRVRVFKGQVLGPDSYRIVGYERAERPEEYRDFPSYKWEAEGLHIVVA